jgi:hypothetical protein
MTTPGFTNPDYLPSPELLRIGEGLLYLWSARVFFFFPFWSGTEFTITEANTGLLYQPQIVIGVEHSVEWLSGETKYSEKPFPSVAFSTSNPTWPDRGLLPGRRGGKPATNRLSYGTATVRAYHHMTNDQVSLVFTSSHSHQVGVI